jgi:hypothetical protein
MLPALHVILFQYIDVGHWYHIAVTYKDGWYYVYLNGEMVYEHVAERPLARTSTHATLAYVERDMFFSGCMDDVSFLACNKLSFEQVIMAVHGIDID